MTEPKKKSKSGYVSFILAALLVAVILILYFQNNEPGKLVLFSSQVEIQRNLLILICITIGFILGAFVMIPGRWRLYRANRKLKKELKNISLPTKDEQYISKS